MNTAPGERQGGPHQAQQVYITCSSDRVILRRLLEQMQSDLEEQQPTVLKYGVSQKQHNGFIVLEAARGIPSAARNWWSVSPHILDYTIYDVASWEQERQAIEQAEQMKVEGEPTITASANSPSYLPEPNPLPPPPVPAPYQAHGIPRPLYTSHDSYWIVWVWEDGAGEGLLLYDEDGQYRAFFLAEETTTLLYTLLERAAGDLLPNCEPDYLAQHAPGVSLIRAHVWALQMEVMRRGLEYSRERRRRRSEQQDHPDGPELAAQQEEGGTSE